MQNSQPESRPKVSVAMITYNHEQFIEQALDSVLMQQVDFDYEIVIGDDLSQDRTREILLDYHARHPEKIHLLLYETKQGPGGNIYQVLNNCQGEYIALLEGDDYWTSPEKLQVQVNYLDQWTNCSLCFHSIQRLLQDEQAFVSLPSSAKENLQYGIDDLLNGVIFPRTCTVVCRAKLFEFPERIKELHHIDTLLWCLFAAHGFLGYIGGIQAVYRVHSTGMWQSASEFQRWLRDLKTHEYLNEYFNYIYNNNFKIRKSYMIISIEYRAIGQDKEAYYYFRKSFFGKNLEPINMKWLFYSVLAAFSYPLYKNVRIVSRSLFRTYLKIRSIHQRMMATRQKA